MSKTLKQYQRQFVYSILLFAGSLFLFCSCIHGDWGREIKRISFVPEVLGKLAQSHGKAVLLTETQTQELLACLTGPAKREFLDNKYVKYKNDIWAVYWRDYDRTVRTNKVFLVHYSLDDTCYMALVFDSNGELTETLSSMRGGASYEPLDKGPIQ